MQIVGPDDKDLMEWCVPMLREMEGTDLIYHEAAKKQVMFVRDTIAPLVMKPMNPYLRPEVTLPHPEGGTYETTRTAYIVGMHTSKSCELPVYCFERPDIGLSFVMRDNFHDWKLSVLSETRIEVPQLKMLAYTEPPREPGYTGNCLSSCYFQGFKEEWCFGFYEDDHRQFSLELYGNNALWTTIFLIMNSLGQMKPRRQHTQEEHSKALAADRVISKKYWDDRKKERAKHSTASTK